MWSYIRKHRQANKTKQTKPTLYKHFLEDLATNVSKSGNKNSNICKLSKKIQKDSHFKRR